MHIEEIIQKIGPTDKECAKLAQARFDALIKPVGSLAQLERMTAKYAGIVGKYNKHELEYPKRELLVWCGIDEAEQAGKIMQAEWPVNVLAKLCSSLPRLRPMPWRRALRWCRKAFTSAGWGCWALAAWLAWIMLIMRWCRPLWSAAFCRLRPWVWACCWTVWLR